MAQQLPIQQIRNIGIIAHIDAGKTTVTERVLYYTGKTYKIGEVHEGTAVMDWMAQERERGITITAAATTSFWSTKLQPAKYQINIIDTPGHIDFTAEVQRSLRVLDGAVVVFDGVAGVEPQSETVWHQADKFNVPRICFINKLDRIGADFEKSLNSILERLTARAVAMQIPIGLEERFEGIIDLLKNKEIRWTNEDGSKYDEKEISAERKAEVAKWRSKSIEKIVEQDDQLLHKYLSGENIEYEDLIKILRTATISGKIVPVFCGSALKNKGVQLLLDAVVHFLPSPIDIPPVKGYAPDNSETELERKADHNEPLCALAFKIASDPFVGTLTFFRVYSGVLKTGTALRNSTRAESERIGRIVRMHAQHREELTEVCAGDIAAAVGLKNTSTGDTLCDPMHQIVLEALSFPDPVISVAIEPKTKADLEKMGIALNKLAQEDPTFKTKTDIQTSQTIISGMGELHLEIIVDRMKREFNVQVAVGKPEVAYKETINKTCEVEGKYIRQTGGRGQYGHVRLKLEPLEKGAGFEFVNKIKGGKIPAEYIPWVEKGVKNAMEKGVLAGYPMVDIRSTLFDGSYHEVDSSNIAFQNAGRIALQDGARKADPTLLEPIMRLEVIVWEEFMGDVLGDLNSKRAKILNMTDRGKNKVIDSEVPLAEMFDYATILRSLTSGRASFTMEFSHYAEVPYNVREQILNGKIKKE
ncbi:MAG: elongation factor G [Candidatus Nealsonbacteria bacterium CG23_combo_of_CG06-09_8_20_14_all_40_13]|uniref:Elongation factor G n=1 Tax=Candidatus Nealsonbacteria bacterium CG23_combo_of_CG06-09_8_20_14_all_40_13 TaxID=1974724 RepID=A0A2G9YR25_9BACT|nr:MAG: elongation factor G [Candidatus Nealsonbacteria bacterium CG23_combo_of_CG06-09_8_20_14_all_40_13]